MPAALPFVTISEVMTVSTYRSIVRYRRPAFSLFGLLLLGMGMLVPATACSHWGGGIRPHTDGETTHEDETVVLLGRWLHRGPLFPARIAVEFEESYRTQEDRLYVRLNLRNRTRAPVEIQVQTLFKDADWNYIDEKAEWRLIRLKPQETQTYTAVSPSERPRRYTVRVRPFP
jgi:hypothetical protein